MKLSELIQQLEQIHRANGDLPVVVSGVDSGGYDAAWRTKVELKVGAQRLCDSGEWEEFPVYDNFHNIVIVGRAVYIGDGEWDDMDLS